MGHGESFPQMVLAQAQIVILKIEHLQIHLQFWHATYHPQNLSCCGLGLLDHQVHVGRWVGMQGRGVRGSSKPSSEPGPAL